MRRKAVLLLLTLIVANLTLSAAARAVSSDSTAKDTSATPMKSPMKSVFFSAVFPGGGQIYTHNYWQAVGLGTAEVGLAGAAIYEVWQMNRATAQTEIDSHFEKQRSLWWWAAGVWAFSLADAYVDGYLYKFDEQGRVALRVHPGSGLAFVVKKDL